MVQQARYDEPDTWHHVMNRGLAKRTIFGSRKDARYFLSRLARVVREGWLEVHAYSLQVTHFHLLVRSLEGKLSLAMLRLQNGYVRWFNRRYGRDGPLFRGRFRSRRIDSNTYIRTVVRYIDQNAVDTRLVQSSKYYPYSSAWHYARPSGPAWLSRGLIEDIVNSYVGTKTYNPDDYYDLFGSTLEPHEVDLVESRFKAKKGQEDPLDYLISSSQERIKSWLKHKAALADGTNPFLSVVCPNTLQRAVHENSDGNHLWHVHWKGRTYLGWPILMVGLLRDACGLSFKEIAVRADCGLATVNRRLEIHAHMLLTNESYLHIATSVLNIALEMDWGIDSTKGRVFSIPTFMKGTGVRFRSSRKK